MYEDIFYAKRSNDKIYGEWQKIDDSNEWAHYNNDYSERGYGRKAIESVWTRTYFDALRASERQPSIANRWDDVKEDFDNLRVLSDPVDSLLSPREKALRLGSLAVAGAGAEVGVAVWSPPLAIILGGTLAAVGAARYMAQRKVHSSESDQLTSYEATSDTFAILEQAYGQASQSYGGFTPSQFQIDSHIDLASVLPRFVHEQRDSYRIQTVLQWIDQRSAKKAVAMSVSSRDNEDIYGETILSNAYTTFRTPAVNEMFNLPVNHATPLSLLALIRMENRKDFIDAFREKFASLAEWRQCARTLHDESQRVSTQLYEHGKAYWDDPQYIELQKRYYAAAEAERMTDLHIASLAYSFHQKHVALDDVRIISRDHLPQAQRWEAALSTLCSLPLTGLSSPMQELLTNTVDICSRMTASGNYGEKAERIVQIIAGAQMDVDTENRHTDVWRNIQSVAYGN